MAKGIRSYGPGKFSTVLDSYLYALTLDGGADEEAFYEDGGGYLLMFITPDTAGGVAEIASERDDALTEDELAFLRTAEAVILFERSDGIVESSWYEDAKEAQKNWEEIEQEVSSEEYADEDEAYEAGERRPRGTPDEHLVRELVLYAQNDGDLYRQRVQPIMANLRKKMEKGTYDPEKAIKVWQYLADDAAKRYTKEFGNNGPHGGFGIFSPADRYEAAVEFRDDFQAGAWE